MSEPISPPDHPPDPPACPFCGEDRMIEQLKTQWVCYVCAKSWQALTYQDKRFLKTIHVTTES